MRKVNIKKENGVTLASLVLYVIVFSIILGLLANLTSNIYGNMSKIESNTYSSEEFNKFNLNFIKDVKKNTDFKIEENSGDIKIILSDGTNYSYINNENAIYRNKIKIAKKIARFEAERQVINNKVVARITIGTGHDNDNIDFGKTIKYVFRYW